MSQSFKSKTICSGVMLFLTLISYTLAWHILCQPFKTRHVNWCEISVKSKIHLCGVSFAQTNSWKTGKVGKLYLINMFKYIISNFQFKRKKKVTKSSIIKLRSYEREIKKIKNHYLSHRTGSIYIGYACCNYRILYSPDNQPLPLSLFRWLI